MALVLSRKAGEKLMIGDDITVTLVGISGHQARISIDAPKSVSVDRAEIRARKEMEARGYDSDDERGNR